MSVIAQCYIVSSEKMSNPDQISVLEFQNRIPGQNYRPEFESRI